MSSTSPTAARLSTVSNLQEFLDSVPYSLTAVLVRLAPHFSAVRNAAEILTWSSSSYYDSWLALAAWWTFCLLADIVIRYLLPIAVSLSLVVLAFTSHPRVTPPPISEGSLQTAITDLTTLQSLLPGPNSISVSLPPTPTLFRICVILYIPYLVLTHFVPLRIILGISGSVLLTWKSPWATVLRNALSRSAWTRWAVYYIWSKISGQPLPPRTISPQSIAAASGEKGDSLRFLFTVFENQRWWMGLDFTAALLPSERPSWCSVSLQPVSPPNAFTLPDPTTVYLRDRNGKRVKRTATWRWEEPEWKVLITKEDGAVSRVEKPLPSVKEDNASFLMKAAGKMKEVNSPTTPGGGDGDHVVDEADGETEDEDIPTDLDGWVYGDNKWEGKTSKGGMGKYTRYRRWTRVAVVSEVVEAVEDGDIGIERARGRSSIATSSSVTNSPPRRSTDSSDSSPLRQRLKSALAKSTAH